jgi:hypothetical protein
VQTAGKKVGKKNRKKNQRDPDADYQEGGYILLFEKRQSEKYSLSSWALYGILRKAYDAMADSLFH